MDNRRYTLDVEVFERPLVAETAWVLGLIVGDGCITQRGGVVQAVDLVGDEDVVQKAAVILGSNASSKHLKGGCYNIRFFSPRLAQSLVTRGITPAKAHTVPWPEVSGALERHFLRGLWEADGCVTHNDSYGKRRVALSMTSCSKSLMDRVLEVLHRETGSHSKLYPSRGKYIATAVGGKAVILGEWLWGGVPPHMRSERKRAKFLTLSGKGGDL